MNYLKQFYYHKISRGLFVTLFISILFSCNKHPLDTVPLTSFSDEAVWNDPALIETFINNTYRLIPHGYSYSGTTTLGLGTVTDELYKRGGGADFINSGNLTPDNLGLLDYWTGTTANHSYWPVITKCNIFFANIDRAEFDQNEKNDLIGQMKFLRAYSYFRLATFFGAVPLITQPFELDNNFNDKRTPYDDVMDFVVDELNEAINLLPADRESAEMGKIDKGIGMAMKSRVLLYMASPLNNPNDDKTKWEAARDASIDVINLHKYDLLPDYDGIFQASKLYNAETIWVRPFNFPTDPEAEYPELALYPNGYNGFGQVHPLQNLVDDFEMLNGEKPVLGYNSNGTQIVNPAANYDPKNPYEGRDPRFYLTINFNGALFKGRPIETFLPKGQDSNEGNLSPWNATSTGYYVRKFIDESITNPSSGNHSNNPWVFMRYAEVLLNYAETEFHMGNDDICRDYINKIRRRTGINMPDIPGNVTGQKLLEALYQERRIELVFEGFRYFDVRRWKIAPDVLTIPGRKVDIKKSSDGSFSYTYSDFDPRHFSSKNYLLPVPQKEIDKNENLLPNNSGY